MYKIIRHIGDGNFECVLEDGSVKEAGPNICGMIRYTYFDNYKIPDIGWYIEREILLENYHKKVLSDIQNGKLIFNKSTQKWEENGASS